DPHGQAPRRRSPPAGVRPAGRCRVRPAGEEGRPPDRLPPGRRRVAHALGGQGRPRGLAGLLPRAQPDHHGAAALPVLPRRPRGQGIAVHGRQAPDLHAVLHRGRPADGAEGRAGGARGPAPLHRHQAPRDPCDGLLLRRRRVEEGPGPVPAGPHRQAPQEGPSVLAAAPADAPGVDGEDPRQAAARPAAAGVGGEPAGVHPAPRREVVAPVRLRQRAGVQRGGDPGLLVQAGSAEGARDARRGDLRPRRAAPRLEHAARAVPGGVLADHLLRGLGEDLRREPGAGPRAGPGTGDRRRRPRGVMTGGAGGSVRLPSRTEQAEGWRAPGQDAGWLNPIRERFLLRLLVRKELRVRYRGSALGMLWSYVKPAVQFVVFYIALGVFLQLQRDTPAYAVYLFSGIVVVNLFGEVFGNATARSPATRRWSRRSTCPASCSPGRA